MTKPQDKREMPEELRKEMERLATAHADAVYESMHGFPSDKEWPALKANYGFRNGFTAAYELMSERIEKLEAEHKDMAELWGKMGHCKRHKTVFIDEPCGECLKDAEKRIAELESDLYFMTLGRDCNLRDANERAERIKELEKANDALAARAEVLVKALKKISTEVSLVGKNEDGSLKKVKTLAASIADEALVAYRGEE